MCLRAAQRDRPGDRLGVVVLVGAAWPAGGFDFHGVGLIWPPGPLEVRERDGVGAGRSGLEEELLRDPSAGAIVKGELPAAAVVGANRYVDVWRHVGHRNLIDRVSPG